MSASSRSENVRGTISKVGDSVILPLNGLPAAGLSITGTWVGTLQVEETFDGDNWSNAKLLNEADAAVSLPLTANQIGLIKAHGRAAVRVRASAWTSGSAVVVLNATEGIVQTPGSGGSGGGSTDPTAPNAVELSDGAAYYQAATQTTAAAIKAKTDNLDVALSTRTKPADQQHAIVDSSALPTGASTEATLASILAKIIAAPATEATLALIKAKTDNLDVALSTRTKPADAQHTIIDSAALPAGAATETTLGGVLKEGTDATGVSMPAGGASARGWLSSIWKALTDRLPSALISNRLDVNLGAAPATVTAQGGAAAGAAVAGNPNLTGISDGTNVQNLKQMSTGVGLTAQTGIAAVGLYLVNAANDLRVAESMTSLTDGGNSGNIMAVHAADYNGSNADKHRNNVDANILTSASRTTTQTSADIITYNCQGIIVTVDTTVVPGAAPSNVLTINYRDPTSGKYINLLTGAAIVAVGTVRYRVDPRLLAVANLVANDVIGRTLQVVLAAGNANAATYTIGSTLIPG